MQPGSSPRAAWHFICRMKSNYRSLGAGAFPLFCVCVRLIENSRVVCSKCTAGL